MAAINKDLTRIQSSHVSLLSCVLAIASLALDTTWKGYAAASDFVNGRNSSASVDVAA
jgi:hypothetical protein